MLNVLAPEHPEARALLDVSGRRWVELGYIEGRTIASRGSAEPEVAVLLHVLDEPREQSHRRRGIVQIDHLVGRV